MGSHKVSDIGLYPRGICILPFSASTLVVELGIGSSVFCPYSGVKGKLVRESTVTETRSHREFMLAAFGLGFTRCASLGTWRFQKNAKNIARHFVGSLRRQFTLLHKPLILFYQFAMPHLHAIIAEPNGPLVYSIGAARLVQVSCTMCSSGPEFLMRELGRNQ